jgi:hypothetical protein
VSTDHSFESQEHTMEPDGAMVTIRHNGRPGLTRFGLQASTLEDVVVEALQLTGLHSRESGVWTIEARLEDPRA